MDLSLWTPYIKEAFSKTGINASPNITSGIPGTYPTFIVDDRWVIKFFGRLFDGQESYLVEKNVTFLINQSESIPAPSIFFTGELFPEENLSWPFLIFNFIRGISIGTAYKRISDDEKFKIAKWLGKHTRILHEIQIPKEIQAILPKQLNILDFDPDNCIKRQRQFGILPEYLIKQIKPFLDSTWGVELSSRSHHLIHADLTADHILGNLKGKSWKTLAVIDYGDAMIGNLAYELIAVHLDLFKCNKKLLQKFFEGYGNEDSISLENLPIAGLRMMLLHRFSVLEFLSQAKLAPENCPDLYYLADQIWDFNSPNNLL